jgi:hypothetical protein
MNEQVNAPDDLKELQDAQEHWLDPMNDAHCDNLTVASYIAEILALRQQVERLSAPVTDAECEQFDLDCNGHFSRMGIEALLAARKGAAS